MRRLWQALAVAAVAAALPAVAFAGGRPTDGAAPAGVDTGSALVQLDGAPLATYEKTKPTPGKKVDFSSSTVKAYKAQLNALRNDFKAWLKANAPKAKVTGEYDLALNGVAVKLNGESLATIRTAPMVQRAEYEGLYSPAATDPDLSLIDAFGAWAAGGQSGPEAGVKPDGTRVKVAIVDTGIDVGHPCFDDAGYAPQPGHSAYTNNKVIVAEVFYNKASSRGLDAAAVQDHGTHVAGTVACNFETPASVGGVSIPYGVSGVAPGAILGSYNVFPGTVQNARSEDILNALDAAYADGMDVANMSLGGSASGIQDLLTIAVDNLDQAGMVVAVAAGNSGPGHDTVESPGSAVRALTAGASTVPHFVGAPLTVAATTYGAAAGDFATVTADLTAPLGVVAGSINGLGTACTALPAGSLSGKIALISRGTCSFSTKIRNAQAAGASAALIANNVAGDPVAMAQDGTPDQPTIPGYMVAQSTGAALAGSGGASATIGAVNDYISTPNANIMAGFSSQGPTDVDFRVKPDVVAPGVNVLSSIPSTFCAMPPCWAFFQGTSMATPHLAGSAAVVLGQHPAWSSAQVRSAIVNTATQGVLTDYRDGATVVDDPNVTGAGLENLAAAVDAQVALEPVSVSFGAVPAGSGQTRTATVSLTDLGGSGPYTASVSTASGSGVLYGATVSGSTVTVTMSAAKGASPGGHHATLTISNGSGEIAHAAVYTLVK